VRLWILRKRTNGGCFSDFPENTKVLSQKQDFRRISILWARFQIAGHHQLECQAVGTCGHANSDAASIFTSLALWSTTGQTSWNCCRGLWPGTRVPSIPLVGAPHYPAHDKGVPCVALFSRTCIRSLCFFEYTRTCCSSSALQVGRCSLAAMNAGNLTGMYAELAH
jgi:hypothetical protein